MIVNYGELLMYLMEWTARSSRFLQLIISSGQWNARTPHIKLSSLSTFKRGVSAIIGASGRYFDIILAVYPEAVIMIIFGLEKSIVSTSLTYLLPYSLISLTKSKHMCPIDSTIMLDFTLES